MKHMTTIDKRFDKETISLFESMIGKTFNEYLCDHFTFSTSVFGIVGMYIDNKPYKLTNNIEVLNYFGQDEDVAVFKFSSCSSDEIVTQEDDGELNTTPVNCSISNIAIIEENQQLFHNNELTYNIFVPRAIIFYFTDGHEIMFEKDIWFSETITIHKGYNLKSQLSPIDEFLECWEDSNEYFPKCFRHELSIKN